ncbi:HEPN domain-containing protein [soil metagenome]|jgi:uncharacterized protein (UPF0332 family)|nr:HEPN domain-containing protein [Gemmatimonadota bacterium]
MREEAVNFLVRADRSIEAAATLLTAGFEEEAVSRAYYARPYTASALLSAERIRFRKHSSVHAAYGKHFAKSGALDPKYHRWLLEAFARRAEADYGEEVTVTSEQVEQMLARAREFLEAARAHLNRPGSTDDETK